MVQKMIKTYKRELKSSNCGLHHDEIDSMVRSQWQSRSKNYLYLVYRWMVAIFFIVAITISIQAHLEKSSFGLFFIYLTRWGLLLNTIVGIYGAVLVTVWHFHTDFNENILQSHEMPAIFKIYWALHNISMIISFIITTVYWTVLHKPNADKPIDPNNFLSHAMNSVFAFLDVLIVSHPIRLFHVIQPMAFGLTYGLFSYIYYVCGGVNVHGDRFVYSVLDWAKPQLALGTVCGTVVLAIIVHILCFWIYKLRVFIQRYFFSNEFTLPVPVTRSQNGFANESFKEYNKIHY